MFPSIFFLSMMLSDFAAVGCVNLRLVRRSNEVQVDEIDIYIFIFIFHAEISLKRS